MDRDRYITINGNTYLQLGLIRANMEADKVYGIKSSNKSTSIGELVEVEGGGSSTIPTATTEVAGIVKPDGISVTVESDGTIAVPHADESGTYGLVKIDNRTIQLGTDGKLFARRSEILDGLETLLISKNILTLQDIQTIDPEYQP